MRATLDNPNRSEFVLVFTNPFRRDAAETALREQLCIEANGIDPPIHFLKVTTESPQEKAQAIELGARHQGRYAGGELIAGVLGRARPLAAAVARGGKDGA